MGPLIYLCLGRKEKASRYQILIDRLNIGLLKDLVMTRQGFMAGGHYALFILPLSHITPAMDLHPLENHCIQRTGNGSKKLTCLKSISLIASRTESEFRPRKMFVSVCTKGRFTLDC